MKAHEEGQMKESTKQNKEGKRVHQVSCRSRRWQDPDLGRNEALVSE